MSGHDPAEAPVVIVHGPGRTPLHLVLRGAVELGRDCAGLLLDDPGVSRRHVELRPDGGRVIVTDLGSTNGTTVDGRRIDAPVALGPGALLRLGDTTVRVTGPRTDVSRVEDDRTAGGPTQPSTAIERVAAEAAADRPSPPRNAVDRGTVTIVFTDIESSTALADRLGDRTWFKVLAHHNRIVRARLAEHGGTEIKSQGDGFMLTFGSAGRALDWMIAVQRELASYRAEADERDIHIRVGGHTGEAIVGDDGDLFGHHVNLAARIAGHAAGDEILVSSLVHEIVRSRGDLRFGEPRRTELKGLAGTFTLHPVVWS